MKKIVVSLLFVLISAFAVLLTTPRPAQTFSSGESGYSGNPATHAGATCTSCHSSGAAPTIALIGSGSVLSGATNSYTLTVSGGSASNGGLDVSAVGGTFTAGTGSKVSGGEITQTTGLAGATKSWTFSWTAPTVTAATNINMYGAGIDAFSGGTATIVLPIMVSPGAPPPSAVTISPTVATVQVGQTMLFTGTATNSTQGVTYSVSPSIGTIVQTGLFTATTVGMGTVTATSVQDPTKSASATVTVTATSPTTFSISGTVTSAGTGATVSLTGTSTGMVTASSTGSYTFTGLANGPYTVTPLLSGVVFSPLSRTVMITGGSLTGVDFTAPAVTSTSNLVVSPKSLTFRVRSAGRSAPNRTLRIDSSGPSLQFTLTSSAPWLIVSSLGGTTPARAAVSVDSTGLAAGTSKGTITISSAGAGNSPQTVPVTLVICAPSSVDSEGESRGNRCGDGGNGGNRGGGGNDGDDNHDD
jgi:hypothetical protein